MTAASSMKPSELFATMALRLDVTRRQAELLYHLAQREIVETRVLVGKLGLNSDTIKVHASNLRKRGFGVRAKKFLGYYLSLADRERVLAAASVAPPGALPSLGVSSHDSAGVFTGAGPFQGGLGDGQPAKS